MKFYKHSLFRFSIRDFKTVKEFSNISTGSRYPFDKSFSYFHRSEEKFSRSINVGKKNKKSFSKVNNHLEEENEE